jgi:hypothetical protein
MTNVINDTNLDNISLTVVGSTTADLICLDYQKKGWILNGNYVSGHGPT